MQPSHLLGAGVLLAAVAVVSGRDGASFPAAPGAPAAPDGHYVLVIEGDRDQLAVTGASRKADAWAGVPKGLTSDWRLSIRDAAGSELAAVPLDLVHFDLDPARKGQPLRVSGCVVRDPRVAMLANVPCYAEAAAYVFLRGDTIVGRTAAADVRDLAGGGR